MKCPKCGYLGYQDVERCRNCGYEFSLVSGNASELRLREPEPERGSLGDLDLIDNRMAAAARQALAAAAAERAAETSAGESKDDGELPLFGDPNVDDTPLITKASPPRPPLAVRRATPEIPRLRAEARMPSSDAPTTVTSLAPGASKAQKPAPTPPPASAPVAPPPLVTAAQVPPPEPPAATSLFNRQIEADSAEPLTRPATAGERIIAGVVDLVLLLCVDLVIVYFTLKVCRLSASELLLLPPVPTIAFLLLQNVGYLVVFTTAGQTLGKMVTGLRVVDDDRGTSPGLGRATARAALTLLLALPAGLGLLPVLFSQDGRGLHDRLAGTRVVHTAG